MDHAARYHITSHYQEDPALYQKLSERLEALLRQLQDNQVALARELRAFVQEYQALHTQELLGLGGQVEGRFLRLMIAEAGFKQTPPKAALDRLAHFPIQGLRIMNEAEIAYTASIYRQSIEMSVNQNEYEYITTFWHTSRSTD